MTTLADLIDRTRSVFYTETRDEMNRLSSGITAGATSLAVDFDLRGIQAGARLVIDQEEFHVWSANANQITVVGAQAGTTAADHAQGAVVYVNPKIGAPEIIRAINDDLNDLSGQGLYQVKSVVVDYDAGTDTYDLSGVTDLIGVLAVKYDANDGTSRWPAVTAWRLDRDLNTSDFASGLALTIDGWAQPGRPIRVSYKAPFTPLTNLSDNVATVAGLPTNMHDLPPLGASIALAVGTEISRNFLTQMDTRRGDEVPPGSRAASMRAVAAWRQQRINAELTRLYSAYPVVKP